MVIISCGAAKIQTVEPIQAWKLYCGGHYKSMLNLAVRLSPEVYILSAGYGLLKANDLVLPYDRKMDNARAKFFKDWKMCQFNGHSLLPVTYEKAILGTVQSVIPKGLRMGKRVQYANQKAASLPILVDLSLLPNGTYRELVK